MARLILQKTHEIGKKPLAVPKPPHAGARARSFLEDGGSQASIRSDHEEYRTPVRQNMRTDTSVDRNPALRKAGQPPPSCSELARELDATQRRLSDLEYSIRAEIQDLREELRARPRLALSRERVTRGSRDHRLYTSEDESGLISGAEEGIQRIVDREVAARKTNSRRHRRRRSTSSDSCDSDSSSRSERENVLDDMRQPKSLWKGPRCHGLEELRTAHDDFRHALSYVNADETQDRHVFSHAHKFRRRVEATMKDCKFDGSKLIEILQFLRMCKTQCDKNDIAEGAALIILPDFLAGAAETTHLNELELGNEGSDGITSFCHAVQFLLRRFAADLYIDRAFEDFESVRQKDEGDETTYAQRLRAKARCVGAVYRETDIITRFIRDLNPL